MRGAPQPKAWTGILLADLVSIRDRLRGLGFSAALTGPSDMPGRALPAASHTSGTPGAIESLLRRAESIMLGSCVEVGSIETGIRLFEPSSEDEA